MNDKPLWRQELNALIVLGLPIIISQLAQIGMNFTDTIMAGRHSDVSLAGVAVGSSLWVPGFLFMVGVMMAITPMIAQAWGRQDVADIRQTFQQGIWLSIGIGVLMLALLQAAIMLFDYVDMEPAVRAQAEGYVYAVSWGLPPLAMFQVLRGLNEGAHFTRPYMYVSLAAVLFNIPLNYIFVYGKFGLPEMGGVGCGWATAIIMWLELFILLLITIYNRRLRPLKWHSNWQPPNRQALLAILRLGIPIGVMLLIESSMFALVALFLAKLGSVVVAGHQVAMSFISMLFMVPLSLSMALTIRCGFYIGKQDKARSRLVAITGLIVTVLFASLFSAVILLFSDQIAALYTSDSDVQMIAVSLLFLAAIFQFSDGLQVASAGILRGYKDTRFAFYAVFIAYWLIGLPLGYLLGLTDIIMPMLGAEGFWISMVAGLGLASALLVARVFYVSRTV